MASQQRCDRFSWAVKGLSHTYTCIHTHPQTPLPPRLPHDIEQSSLCCPAGPCWFSISNTAVCPCPSQTPWLSLPPIFPLGTIRLLESIEQSSLCCPAGACCFSMLTIALGTGPDTRLWTDVCPSFRTILTIKQKTLQERNECHPIFQTTSPSEVTICTTRFKVRFPTMVGSFLPEKESCQVCFPAVCVACSLPWSRGQGSHREVRRKAVRFSLDLGLCGYRYSALSSILLCLGAISSLDLCFKWQERFSFWSWACDVSMQEHVSALWIGWPLRSRLVLCRDSYSENVSSFILARTISPELSVIALW